MPLRFIPQSLVFLRSLLNRIAEIQFDGLPKFHERGNSEQGDVDGSGGVDSTDLGLLLNRFGHTSLSASAVPEPGGMLAWAFATFLALTAARRR